MRETLALEMLSSTAMCSCVRRSRRKLSTAAQVASGIWLGDERGFEERSRKPSTPSALKRATHLATVFVVVLYWRAAAALLMPRSTTARTMSSRPLGVRRALLWVFIRSPRESLRSGDISVPGPDRMDNLLKVHSYAAIIAPESSRLVMVPKDITDFILWDLTSRTKIGHIQGPSRFSKLRSAPTARASSLSRPATPCTFLTARPEARSGG